MNDLPVAAYRAKIIGFVGVEIDEIISVERRLIFSARAGLPSTCALVLFDDMNACAAETIDVDIS